MSSLEDARREERSTIAFVAFALLTFILVGRPQDYLPALAPFRPGLLATVITVILTALQVGRIDQLFATKEAKLYTIWYAAMIVGIPFSVYRPGSFDAVILEYSVNVAYFFLFLIHIGSVDRMRRVILVLFGSLGAFVVHSLAGGTFTGGRFVTGGRMYDPNDIAFVIVSLLCYPLWVLLARAGLLLKAIALATVMAGLVVLLFTASRGGLLAAVTFFTLFLGLQIRKVGRAPKMVLLIALVFAILANFEKLNVERFLTLTSIENDYNFEAGGRTDIWTRGWQLFVASPLTGVGVSGFGKAIGDMRAAEFGQIPLWQNAHSAYVLVLAETGLLGSVPFALLIIASLLTFNRLRRHWPETEDLAALPGLLLIGFCAQLIAAAFLSQSYSMLFTVAFAMSAALNQITRGSVSSTTAAAIEGRRT